MPYCPNCGVQVAATDTVCQSCGGPLDASQGHAQGRQPQDHNEQPPNQQAPAGNQHHQGGATQGQPRGDTQGGQPRVSPTPGPGTASAAPGSPRPGRTAPRSDTGPGTAAGWWRSEPPRDARHRRRRCPRPRRWRLVPPRKLRWGRRGLTHLRGRVQGAIQTGGPRDPYYDDLCATHTFSGSAGESVVIGSDSGAFDPGSFSRAQAAPRSPRTTTVEGLQQRDRDHPAQRRPVHHLGRQLHGRSDRFRHADTGPPLIGAIPASSS